MTSTLIITLVASIIGLWLFLFIFPVDLWITARFSGVRIGLVEMVFMRIRKVPPRLIARSMIIATKAGIEEISTQQMETHHLAHGNLKAVINALIVADKANLKLTFKQATAIDLAGRNVLEAVQVSVTPYMILVPAITGVALDGIQLIGEARVTVRTNLEQLVGGAGEETIKARVGQGIISCIGNAETYLEVLENPADISKLVLDNGLDSGTAYEILSIDIADINIGKNIGAELQTDQALADLSVAKAKAEERRAMAVAAEQEQAARVQEAKTQLIQNQAQIPVALSGSFRKGNLGRGFMKGRTDE
ncbi:MAG: flotillin-like protein FloA [Roseivirga sp.]|nr:flotillin-like protein FloA [Roseivirga sp.]